MKFDHLAIHDAINTDTLTPLVQKSIKNNEFQILSWHVEQLGGGAGNPVSFGLFRFSGSGQAQNEQKNWSIILKIIQSPANVGSVNMGEGEDVNHWNFWRREPLVYQSGFLDTLPDGLAAPRMIQVEELPGNFVFLWLEDIIDDQRMEWTTEQYSLIARYLGRLNGSTVDSKIHSRYPWISLDRNRSWIALMPWNVFPWDHSKTLVRYRPPESNSFKKLLLENDRFLSKLDQIPQTISHGDTYPTNFKLRDLKDGQTQIVALDWALMGISPIGDDLGQFTFGAINQLKTENPIDVDQMLFENYLKGLEDVGCHVERDIVRFGFTASASFRVGLFQIYLLSEEIGQNKLPTESSMPSPRQSICFEEMMAEEAITLLDVIHI